MDWLFYFANLYNFSPYTRTIEDLKCIISKFFGDDAFFQSIDILVLSSQIYDRLVPGHKDHENPTLKEDFYLLSKEFIGDVPGVPQFKFITT